MWLYQQLYSLDVARRRLLLPLACSPFCSPTGHGDRETTTRQFGLGHAQVNPEQVKLPDRQRLARLPECTDLNHMWMATAARRCGVVCPGAYRAA
jgi:hypothetical protein